MCCFKKADIEFRVVPKHVMCFEKLKNEKMYWSEIGIVFLKNSPPPHVFLRTSKLNFVGQLNIGN